MRIKEVTPENKKESGTECCGANFYFKNIYFVQKGKRAEVWGSAWMCTSCKVLVGHYILNTRLDYATLIVAARHGGQVWEGKDGKIEPVFKCAGCEWCAPKKKDG